MNNRHAAANNKAALVLGTATGAYLATLTLKLDALEGTLIGLAGYGVAVLAVDAARFFSAGLDRVAAYNAREAQRRRPTPVAVTPVTGTLRLAGDRLEPVRVGTIIEEGDRLLVTAGGVVRTYRIRGHRDPSPARRPRLAVTVTGINSQTR